MNLFNLETKFSVFLFICLKYFVVGFLNNFELSVILIKNLVTKISFTYHRMFDSNLINFVMGIVFYGNLETSFSLDTFYSKRKPVIVINPDIQPYNLFFV